MILDDELSPLGIQYIYRDQHTGNLMWIKTSKINETKICPKENRSSWLHPNTL